MNYLSSSIIELDAFSNNETFPIPYSTPPLTNMSQDDQTQSTQVDDLLLQIPTFLEEQLPLKHNSSNQNQGQQRRKTWLSLNDQEGNERNPDDKDSKKKQKIIHREIERQRRLEMSSLHASLRTLLPLEYIKGKRSMSDHLVEAVKYIRHLQENIQRLSDKRDALKPTSSSKLGHDNKVNESENDELVVSVSPCKGGGVEVIVSTNHGGVDEARLPLSSVLQILTKEGLDVVSCISNKANHKLVHSIQAQVGDERSISFDPVKLQEKLADFPNFFSS